MYDTSYRSYSGGKSDGETYSCRIRCCSATSGRRRQFTRKKLISIGGWPVAVRSDSPVSVGELGRFSPQRTACNSFQAYPWSRNSRQNSHSTSRVITSYAQGSLDQHSNQLLEFEASATGVPCASSGSDDDIFSQALGNDQSTIPHDADDSIRRAER